MLLSLQSKFHKHGASQVTAVAATGATESVVLTTLMIESAGHGKAAVRLAALVLMGDVEKIATFQPPF